MGWLYSFYKDQSAIYHEKCRLERHGKHSEELEAVKSLRRVFSPVLETKVPLEDECVWVLCGRTPVPTSSTEGLLLCPEGGAVFLTGSFPA